ncbi:hypothetical protein [Haloarchaeobius sp. TZWWS8]|uniref:LVIVD repeat-containing protein n=1 Tax=Haloarchaeobius sp. TZWWS8 TaxID=3446121 RepID=UPI003EBFD527
MALRPSRQPYRPTRRTLLGGLAAIPAFAAGVTATDSTSRRTDRQPADSTALDPAATLELDGATEVVVDESGETVFVATQDGFAILDVGDPSNPQMLAEERDLTVDGEGPMEAIYDVKYDDDRLLVAGPNGGNSDLVGFFVYDVSDRANPERIAFQRTSHAIHNCFLRDGVAYLTAGPSPGAPTMFWDVSGDDPGKVGSWKASDADEAWADAGENFRQTHDIYVQDDVLYVAYWDAGTWLVDVSDPANPNAITRFGGHDPRYLEGAGRSGRGFSPEFIELPGNSHYVQPTADGNAVFVGKEAWDDEETEVDGGPGGIELWSRDGSDGTRESIIQTPLGPDSDATSHNLGIRGDRLYASWYAGGVAVYDVSDLAEPTLLGAWSEPETTSFWAAKPIHEGFVATSFYDPSLSREENQSGKQATVYLFPEPSSEGEPAPTMEPRPKPQVETTTTNAATTPEDPPETSQTGTSPDEGPTETDTATKEPAEAADETPGFGLFAGIASVGGAVAAARRLAKRDE